MTPSAAHRAAGDEGQTSVELALTLPFVFVLLLALVQAGLVVRDQLLVTHAAREGARVAAVSTDDQRVRAAAVQASGALEPGRLSVVPGARGQPGSLVTVGIGYDSPVRVPLLGALWPAVHLEARATMRVET